MSVYQCPNCGHPEFYCQGTISANLTVRFNGGELDYQLREWEDVEEVYFYDCPNCNFSFCGDEDEFLRFLAQGSFTVVIED